MAPNNGNGNNGIITQPVPYGGRQSTLSKLQVGSYGTEGDEAEWTYYDRIILATATLNHRMFTNPVGAGGKTLADTNLQVAGQIPQAQSMEVSAIKVMYASSAVKDETDLQLLYDMFDETTVAIKLSNKEYTGIWSLQELLGACLLWQMTPSTAGDNIPQILPKFHGIFPLNRKIVLAALTPFEVTITHHVAANTALDGDHLRIGLSGILTRAT